MARKEPTVLRTIPRALLRAVVGATVGCALSGLVALVGFGLAREAYEGRGPSALKVGAIGGAVILAVPGALAVVRMYSDRERWSPIARTLVLFPGAAVGAIGGVAALTLGWAISWGLQQAGVAGPAQTWSQIILGGTVIGAVLAVVGLQHKRTEQ